MAVNLGSLGSRFQSGAGLLPTARATVTRIRATIRRPTMLTQAQRIEVDDTTGKALELRFIMPFTIGTSTAELYGYYSSEDIVAVMSVYLRTTDSKYVFSLSRNTWDALTAKLDTVVIGGSPTFPLVTAESMVSLGFVTVSAAAK